ncbi:winged helix-turn-helix domain-containing protein [Streptomyces olivaceoviridis]|uniref:Winged helix-turn helix domain-containing protein n=1 Tax=Streptomyces canarius TaxID=285453 RepID=A0ABQ3D1S7_9ACTN|nr:hypothetical protein GCM10010345_68600 [Streptomyces canarius]
MRWEAAERFRQGDEDAVIAHELRVGVRLFAVLGRGLRKGLVAHGAPDQTWTLSRIATLVGHRFHESYTVQGMVALLKRHGWSARCPPAARPSATRTQWPAGGRRPRPIGRTAAALDAWLVFQDEAGFSMTPPTTRIWYRRRLSVAALACDRHGERSRLIYRPCPDARPDGRKSSSWKDYRDSVQTAHQQLGGPIVLVWGILNTHLTAGVRRYIADRDHGEGRPSAWW